LLKRIWLGQDKKLGNLDLIITPPFIYLEPLLLKAKSLRLKVKFGAQNCFWENQGAYTGEISPLMLKNLGAEYAIIGHSERRNYMRESDEMISKKIKSVFENKLTPVLCVGETMEQRAKGMRKNTVQEQLNKDLRDIKNLKNHNLIIAYEPVWAIGTGNYCQPEEALEMIKFIKEIFSLNSGQPSCEENIKVLYGGSVDSKNIANYLKYPEIDGALVGGASIKINEFKKIINEVSKAVKTEPAQK
ncbi:MAG: triose-phosphate isomerase, partial [bacterium]|nr:triose-phosphate isomerase [bacterium]